MIIRKSTYFVHFMEDDRTVTGLSRAKAHSMAQDYVGNSAGTSPFPGEDTTLYGPGDGTTSTMVRQEIEFVSMSKIPYVAFGNETLSRLPDVGETATCPNCGRKHPVEYGDEIPKDGTHVPSKTLGFIKCGETVYLASVKGKQVSVAPPDGSGSVEDI